MMRGKLVVFALTGVLALVLMARMFEVTDEREALPSELSALPMEAEAAPDGFSQVDERSAPETVSQQDNEAYLAQAESQAGGQTGQGQTQAATEAIATAPGPGSVDFTVVDRPFPISESIFAACEKFRRRACELNRALLAEMAKEPREETWATSAEKLIRSFAEQEPGKFTIRTLECRTSICFIETASIFGIFSYPLYHFEKNSGLRAEYAIHSSETDALGAEVRVTLRAFTRK